MFVQVMQGRVRDAGKLRAQWKKWEDVLKPGAEGYLGSTWGVTDDGEFIAVARFESADAARRNSDKPEQDTWWRETAECFEGDVTFHDCTDIDLEMGGGSDRAGFVQVMQGRVRDEERLQQMNKEFEARMSTVRPDVIGGFTAKHGDGTFTSVIYFTSEEEARAGESKGYPDDLAKVFEEWQSLMEDVRYFDLKEPMLSSP